MAATKPGKAETLAAFYDEGTYTALFADGPVSAAYGCANGQSVYVVYQNGQPLDVSDIEKTIRVLKMAAETGAPVVTFYNSNGACLEGGLKLLQRELGTDGADRAHLRRRAADRRRHRHLRRFGRRAGRRCGPVHHERGSRAVPQRPVQQ